MNKSKELLNNIGFAVCEKLNTEHNFYCKSKQLDYIAGEYRIEDVPINCKFKRGLFGNIKIYLIAVGHGTYDKYSFPVGDWIEEGRNTNDIINTICNDTSKLFLYRKK